MITGTKNSPDYLVLLVGLLKCHVVVLWRPKEKYRSRQFIVCPLRNILSVCHCVVQWMSIVLEYMSRKLNQQAISKRMSV